MVSRNIRNTIVSQYYIILQSQTITNLPNILSIETVLGKVQLNILNWRFNRGGMSFRPPPEIKLDFIGKLFII